MSTELSLDERMRAQFEGPFLDASDIRSSGDITLTISAVAAPGDEKDARGKVIDKGIVSFDKAKKRLVLNKTNAKLIAMQHGTKPSAWLGKKITLTVRWLAEAFGQKNLPVIRVLPPSEGDLTFGMRKKYGAKQPFSAENSDH